MKKKIRVRSGGGCKRRIEGIVKMQTLKKSRWGPVGNWGSGPGGGGGSGWLWIRN